MPDPNLIHPVDVVLEQRLPGTTIYDEDTREPVRQAARNVEVTISAQILWDWHLEPEMHADGLDLSESGYFLVKLSEMAAAGITIQQGDRVLSMGGIAVEVYVTRQRPMGHYPGLGATILRCYFTDRSPTHAVGNP